MYYRCSYGRYDIKIRVVLRILEAEELGTQDRDCLKFEMQENECRGRSDKVKWVVILRSENLVFDIRWSCTAQDSRSDHARN